MAEKIGLFFGSSTGATERVAHIIKGLIEDTGLAEVDVLVVSGGSVKIMENYDKLIFGASTWNIGELQDDWALKYPELDSVNLAGRKVAIFGVGDQFGYSNSFLDANGILGDKVIERGGDLVAWWPVDSDFEFEYSRGVVDGVFMGSGFDEDSQADKTFQRAVDWTYWVLEEFGLYKPESIPA